jgi:hypothetical protein
MLTSNLGPEVILTSPFRLQAMYSEVIHALEKKSGTWESPKTTKELKRAQLKRVEIFLKSDRSKISQNSSRSLGSESDDPKMAALASYLTHARGYHNGYVPRIVLALSPRMYPWDGIRSREIAGSMCSVDTTVFLCSG